MNGKEIEIKLQIDKDDYLRLRSFFYGRGEFIREIHQIDLYYSPKDEKYYDSGDRCLRIRTENQSSILSYKRIHGLNTDHQYIEEYETHISNVQSIKKILDALEFKCEIVIDKNRLDFRVDSEFLVSLDSIHGLGYYLEIESINEEHTIQIRNKNLQDFAESLNIDLSKKNTEGYANMLYKKQKEKGNN